MVHAGSKLKNEEELASHVRKALSSDGLGPKSKHVRWCSVYTWDTSDGASFWNAIRALPVSGQDQVAIKALILIHKVIREGHPSVLEEAHTHVDWLRNTTNVSLYNSRGYVIIIKGYANFLISKLQVHRNHREFDSIFTYNEYIALKRVKDPNEGFETTSDLINLLEKIDSLQKLIFTSFKLGSSNEINISALAPLVEESHALYQFLVSFLTAMHKTVPTAEQALSPLRIRFNSVHTALYYFYKNSKTIRYLVSIVDIPTLSKAPPEFIEKSAVSDAKPPDDKPVPVKSQYAPLSTNTPDLQNNDNLNISDLIEYEKRLHNEIEQELGKQNNLYSSSMPKLNQINEQNIQEIVTFTNNSYNQQPNPYVTHNSTTMPDLQSLINYIRMLLSQNHILKMQLENSQNELNNLKRHSSELQMKLTQFSTLLAERDRKISTLDDLLIKNENENLEFSKMIQDTKKTWEDKYNSLAGLYTSLRNEHISVLESLKVIKLNNYKVMQDNAQEIDGLRKCILERDNIINSLRASENSLNDEHERVSRELQIKSNFEAVVKDNMMLLQQDMQKLDLSKSEEEKKHLEELKKLNELNESNKNQLAKKDEEISYFISERNIYQQNLNMIIGENEANIRSTIDKVVDYICQLMDELFYSIKDPPYRVNNFLPENVFLPLGMINDLVNSLYSATSDFYSNTKNYLELTLLLIGVPIYINDLLINCSSLESFHYSGSEQQLNECLELVVISLKNQIRHSSPSHFNSNDINEKVKKTAEAVSKLTELLSHEAPKQLPPKTANLEEEMQVFEEDTKKSSDKMKEIIEQSKHKLPDNIDPHILNLIMDVLTAAATMAKRTCDAQRDIEKKDSQSTLSGEKLYRKSEMWRNGLISAGRLISDACLTLVEDASGLLNFTRTNEQVLISAQEIGAGAVHLITAARVRSYPGQESHNLLEQACAFLRSAVKKLVSESISISNELVSQKGLPPGTENPDVHFNDTSDLISDRMIKKMEIEQKIKIIEIEKQLSDSRFELGKILKMAYTKKKSDAE